MSIDNLANQFSKLLTDLENHIGFKESEESSLNTPKRLARMYANELLHGYQENPLDILTKRFPSELQDMVIVKNIPFVSLCSHHWLPFIGQAHFGYIPNGELVGLSKIPRLVECYAKRFQIQEHMTQQIADNFYDIVKPKGCIVITKAIHMCSQIRGVQSHNTEMIISAVRGCFENKEQKDEFLTLIDA